MITTGGETDLNRKKAGKRFTAYRPNLNAVLVSLPGKTLPPFSCRCFQLFEDGRPDSRRQLVAANFLKQQGFGNKTRVGSWDSPKTVPKAGPRSKRFGPKQHKALAENKFTLPKFFNQKGGAALHAAKPKKKDTPQRVFLSGDPSGIRTPDPLLKRQLLCRLS